MAGGLLGSSSVFRGAVEECAEALAPFVDWSLLEVLGGDGGLGEFDRIDVVQPALFAVMVGLVRLWGACGVEPGMVVGHSQGEVAAAYVAGGLSLSDAARVIALRSRLLCELVGLGSVVSVSDSLERVRGLVGRWGDVLAVAGVKLRVFVFVRWRRRCLLILLRLSRCVSGCWRCLSLCGRCLRVCLFIRR
jgi:acyl transferase domain-containing protein